MKTSIEAKRQKAKELLEELQIYKPYIDGFFNENKVCYYERFAGFWVEQEPEVEKKMREIENKYDCVCYAITHEYLEFGECWSFLLVTDYEDEWEDILCKAGRNAYYAFAYVWNKDDEDCSELGSVAVQSFGGGLRRIG